MNLKKINLFSISEIYQLAKSFIGHRLIASTPIGLIATNKLINTLQSQGIIIEKKNASIFFKYCINDLHYVISLRKNSSDFNVFKQIIMGNEYGVVADFFKNNNIPLKTIIDAGANIGLTSIYFKAYFPNASIIALEPSDNTFKRLNNNFNNNNLTNITALKKGLWGYHTYLSSDTSFRDGQDWAFRLTETSNNRDSFEVVSISDIMNEFNLETIDLLKIDIEGGEVSVFNSESNLSWLEKIKVLALEIHDEFHCRTDIEKILSEFGFILSHFGELTIGINKKLLPNVFDLRDNKENLEEI